jgi:hypothetical protein
MREKITIDLYRLRDNEGNPTCIYNIGTKEVCEYYRTQRFGTWSTCIFAPIVQRGLGEHLESRGELGTLIPGKWCPLFK